jgi:flagellar biosynthesis GTPase FlhF
VVTAEEKQKEKELEQQKEKERLLQEEMQKKKEQDALLEKERIRKEEEARLKKEEEQKQKDLLKVQKEEEQKKIAQEKEAEKERKRKQAEDAAKLKKAKDSEVGIGSILWRSMLFPGWGQIHADHTKTGIGFSTAFAGSLAYAGSLYTAQASAKKSYFASGNRLTIINITGMIKDPIIFPYSIYKDSQNLSAYKAKIQQTNTAAAAAGAVYITSLIHAVYAGYRQKKQDSISANTTQYFLDVSPVPVLQEGLSKTEVKGSAGLVFFF